MPSLLDMMLDSCVVGLCKKVEKQEFTIMV